MKFTYACYGVKSVEMDEVAKFLEELTGEEMELVDSESWGPYMASISRRPDVSVYENFNPIFEYWVESGFEDYPLLISIYYSKSHEGLERALLDHYGSNIVAIEREF